jgi:uncharacterized protein
MTTAALVCAGFAVPVVKALPAAVQRIVEALQPERVILFGSWAHGTPTADSDVDLLVVMDTSAPPLERYLAVSRLLRPRPFPVDILVRTPAEMQRAVESRDPFMKEILSQGVVVYERES